MQSDGSGEALHTFLLDRCLEPLQELEVGFSIALGPVEVDLQFLRRLHPVLHHHLPDTLCDEVRQLTDVGGILEDIGCHEDDGDDVCSLREGIGHDERRLWLEMSVLANHVEEVQIDLRDVMALEKSLFFLIERQLRAPVVDGVGRLWNFWLSYVASRQCTQ